MTVMNELIELKGFAFGAALATDNIQADKALTVIGGRVDMIIAQLLTADEHELIKKNSEEECSAASIIADIANSIENDLEKLTTPSASSLEKPVEELFTNRRTINALIRDNIFTAEALSRCNESYLLSLKGIGQMGLDDIKEALRLNGLTLGM